MKKKGILAVALSLCLVAVVAIGATLALLSDTTEEKVNHFTVSTKGIEIELRELHWDNDPFTGEATLPSEAQATLGTVLAQNIVPLRNIPKDPTVKNVCDHDAWVAIKLEYKKNGNAATYADIADQVDFDVNAPVIDPETAGWIAKDDARGVYYYNATLAAGATTAQALFDQVSIKDVESVYPFDIIVTAYAVQAEGVDTFDEAKIILFTEEDTIEIEGYDLHIQKLNVDDGELIIEGEIVSILYSGRDGYKSKGKGFFKKMLK